MLVRYGAFATFSGPSRSSSNVRVALPSGCSTGYGCCGPSGACGPICKISGSGKRRRGKRCFSMPPTPPGTLKRDCEMLTRRLAKTKHLLATEGPQAVIREIHNSLWLRLRLKAMAHKKSAELDGCNFSLQTIPDSLTKLFLLDGRYELPERRAVNKQ